MPRSARELFLALGASLGAVDNELIVDAAKLRLPAMTGGTLAGDLVIHCFTDDAFGFRAPPEVAGIGVLWAQNLEQPRDLTAMVRDGVERHHRRLRQELSALEALGFATWFSAAEGRPCGAMDLDDTRVEVMLSATDELLLLKVDEEPVPPSKRQVLAAVSSTSPVALIDRLVAHVERVALAAALDSEIGEPVWGEAAEAPALRQDPRARGVLSHTARAEIAALLADENDSEDEFGVQLKGVMARGGEHPMPSDLDDDFDLSDLDLDEDLSEDLSDDLDLDQALDEIAGFGDLSSPTAPARAQLSTDKGAGGRPSNLPTRPVAPPLTADPRLRPPRVTKASAEPALDPLDDDADEATVLRPFGDPPPASPREQPRPAPVVDEDDERTVIGMPTPAPGMASSSREAAPSPPAPPPPATPRTVSPAPTSTPPSTPPASSPPAKGAPPARTPTERRPLPGVSGATQPAGGAAAVSPGQPTETRREPDPMRALASLVGEGLSSGKTGAMVLDADAFAQLHGLEDADDLAAEAEALEAEALALEQQAAELREKAALLRARVPEKAPARKLAGKLAEQRSAAAPERSPAPRGADPAPTDPQHRAPVVSAVADPSGSADRDVFADEGGGAETQVAQFDLSSLRRAEAVAAEPAVAPSAPALPGPDALSRRAPTQAAIAVHSEDFESLSGFSDDFSGAGSATLEVEGSSAVGLVAPDARVRTRLRQVLGPQFPLVTEAETPMALLAHAAQRFSAVVLIQPRHDAAFVASLGRLSELRGAPKVLLLSSDDAFDDEEGIDLRLNLGRKASEVAEHMLEGLARLGIGPASA